MESAANKKSKLCSHDDDDRHEEEDNVNDEEEDQEQKMEEFFALVRRIREARDRLMNNSGSLYHENKHQQIMKRKLLEEKDKPVIREAWKPTFQREDFLPDHHHNQLKNPHVSTLPTSSRDKQGTDQKADQDIKENLDLTLSL